MNAPWNIPKDRKMDQMSIKYTNIFHCKTLQNVPKCTKFGFLVWNHAIWQPCFGTLQSPVSKAEELGSKIGARTETCQPPKICTAVLMQWSHYSRRIDTFLAYKNTFPQFVDMHSLLDSQSTRKKNVFRKKIKLTQKKREGERVFLTPKNWLKKCAKIRNKNTRKKHTSPLLSNAPNSQISA
jgi:hypothetical protein